MPGRSGSPPAVRPASAWTSVPDAWPAAGWTTTPAGLSATIRCSSSYAIRSSGAGRGGGASRACSSSTSSPPSRRWLFARGTPSTSTARAASRRSAATRDPTPGSAATKRSSRSPAAVSGTTYGIEATRAARAAVGSDESAEQDGDADHDEAVGEVERRPVPEVEEIGDVSEPHPVGEVRDAAPDQQADRDRQKRMPRSRAVEVHEHPADGDERQQDHEPRRGGDEPEGDARVLDVVDRQRADDLDVLVESELARDHVLGQLVGDDGGDRDRAQGDPVTRSGGQRPRDHGDRRQAVRPRSRPELLLPGGFGGQPRSCFLLSSMQRVAHGRASRRSAPIGLPQLEHVPNVPSSIRTRAASISFRTWVELSSRVDAISRSNVAVAMSPRWLSWKVGSSVSSPRGPGFSAWVLWIGPTTFRRS